MAEDDPVSFDVEGDLLTELSGGKLDDSASKPDPAANPQQGDSPSLRSSLARGLVDPSVNDEPKDDLADALLPDDPLYVAPDDKGDAEPDLTVDPAAAATTVTPPGPVDVFAIAKAHGIDLGLKYGNDPQKALEGLVNAQKLIGQRDDYATYGKRLVEDPKGVLAYLQSLYPTDAVKPADGVAKPKVGDAPEYDPTWLEMLDAEGKLIPGADPAIPLKLAKYQQWLGNRARDFAADPVGKMLPLLQEQIKAIAREQAEALVAQNKKESEAERYAREQIELAQSLITEESAWAFVEGDKSKGMSPEGQIFHKYLIALETPDPRTGQIPVPDLRHRRDVAKLMTRDELGRTQTKDTTIDRTAKQAKMAKRPNRTAASEPGDRPWPKGLSLEDALLRQLANQK